MEAQTNNSAEAVVQVLILTLYADRLDNPPSVAETRDRLLGLDGPLRGQIKGLGRGLEPLIAGQDRQARDLADAGDLLAATGQALARITDPWLEGVLLDAMCHLAWADTHYHYVDGLMIARAIIHWGLPAPMPGRAGLLH